MTTTQPAPRSSETKQGLWPQVRGSQLTGLLYASIWLVFLLMPILGTVFSDAAFGWKIASYAATAVFGLAYCWLMAWCMNADTRSPTKVDLLVGCLVLAVPVVLAVPAAGSWSTVFLPFIAALVIFNTDPLPGIPVGVLIWIVPTVAAYLLIEQEVWMIVGPGFGMLFIVVSRLTEHYDERARAAEDQLKQIAERDRIARDVHDVLGHSLTVLSIKAQLARRLMETDQQRAQVELDEIEQLARSSLSQVRATVTRLRAPQLPEELDVARTALEAGGISADIQAEEEHSESQLLAWTLRETITNVLRHSQASRCRIEIGPDSLRVTDDGIGMNGHEGSGLRGLRERAKAEGAQVAVSTGDDASGTQIEVRLT